MTVNKILVFLAAATLVIACAVMAGCAEVLPRNGDKALTLQHGWLTTTRSDRCRSMLRGDRIKWECSL